ncbi:MAG: arginase family protein [Candidatus Puniceispirillales bacterium]
MASTIQMGDLFGGEGGETWLNLPAATAETLDSIDIGVVGIGSATPYPVGSYCHEGPDAIRGARSWPTILEQHDFDLAGTTPSAGLLPAGVSAADFGNLDVKPDPAPAATARNREMIRTAIAAMRNRDTVPFILGGDDSVPIPVLDAYAGETDGPISIFQIDAHIDWRDEVNGESLGLSSNMRRASEMDHVGSIVQVAARGIGSARGSDVQDALDYGVAFHTMRMLREPGGIEAAVASLPEGVPVYIALDVDSLDPVLMPAVIGAAQGGLDYWQMMALLEGVAKRAPIVGFNMVELMPDRDVNSQGALMASRLGISMLGLIAAQVAASKA